MHGAAAAGAPLAGAVLEVVDAAGARRRVTVARNGLFSVATDDLTAPLLIEVAGVSGGRPMILHSLAVATDLGARPVNVTPLTELLTAFVLQGDPREVFLSARPDLSGVTAERLSEAEALLAASLGPVLDVFDVGDANVRTAAFTPDGTGFDAALDTIAVSPVKSSGGGLNYQLTVVSEDGPMLVDPSNLGGISLTGVDADVLAAVGDVVPELNARVEGLAALFATQRPSKAELGAFLDTARFRHNGLTFDGYADKVLLADTSFVGSSVSRVTLQRLIDADNAQVSFSISFADASRPPRRESFRAERRDGTWRFLGNGAMANLAVGYMARIQEQALTPAELAARTDLAFGTMEDGRLCYWLANLAAGFGPWMVCDSGDRNFGLLAWGGPLVDFTHRAELVRDTVFIGHASQRVRPFLIPFISSVELDPRVHHVKVRGPGLPDAGLTYSFPRPSIPRDYLILDGDGWDWNAFDTERCSNFNSPEGCALDWDQVQAGSRYSFAFFTEAGVNPIATEYVELSGRPRTIEAWTADMDRLFPRFELAASQHFTPARVFDPSGTFTDGGRNSLDWRLPADPSVEMEGVSIGREYFQGNVVSDGNLRKEIKAMSLIGSSATHFEPQFTEDSDGGYPTWAWANVTAVDLFGNLLQHEVAPVNPY